jgi:hypothetical protein
MCRSDSATQPHLAIEPRFSVGAEDCEPQSSSLYRSYRSFHAPGLVDTALKPQSIKKLGGERGCSCSWERYTLLCDPNKAQRFISVSTSSCNSISHENSSIMHVGIADNEDAVDSVGSTESHADMAKATTPDPTAQSPSIVADVSYSDAGMADKGDEVLETWTNEEEGWPYQAESDVAEKHSSILEEEGAQLSVDEEQSDVTIDASDRAAGHDVAEPVNVTESFSEEPQFEQEPPQYDEEDNGNEPWMGSDEDGLMIMDTDDRPPQKPHLVELYLSSVCSTAFPVHCKVCHMQALVEVNNWKAVAVAGLQVILHLASGHHEACDALATCDRLLCLQSSGL